MIYDSSVRALDYPFLLGRVLEQHLNNLQHNCPRKVEEIRRSLYVNDLISGVTTVTDAQHFSRPLSLSSGKEHLSFINSIPMCPPWMLDEMDYQDKTATDTVKNV